MARPSRFSPRSETHEALEERTVCREEMCASLVRGVADAVRTGQARFDLLLGPRGAGKSHMLGLIEGRLRKELADTAIVTGPPEEFHPSSLIHLLAEILSSLPPDPEVGAVGPQLAILHASAADDARDRAVGMIRARLEGLSLVIVIENLDLIFAAIGRNGQSQLRSILQTERRWSIVASSRSRAPAFSKESEPFFGMFIPRVLEPLSAEGCREMLVRLARACESEELALELETPKGLARVQTLRHVLGGYPRAMAFISPHLHHDRPDSVEVALRDLAEELTPYFQEQMSRLPAGQRPIAELLAEHWRPLSVGEIAQATFSSPATTSTNLRRLRDDAIVRHTKLGREHFYEISEPMFRIARAMKRDDLQARTFLRVLKSWYEFRGLEIWQLPLAEQAWMRSAPDPFDAYTHVLIAPLLRKLQEGRYQQVLDEIGALDTYHELFLPLRMIALGHLGRDDEAFAQSMGVGSFGVIFLAAAAWSIECTLAKFPHPRRFLDQTDRGSSFGRFAAAIALVVSVLHGDDRGSPSVAVDVIESLLHSSSGVVRRATTKMVLETGLLLLLARAGENGLCGRILARLEPVASAAMSFTLATIAVQGWMRGTLPEIFQRAPGESYALTLGLGGIPKLGMALACYEGELPSSVGRDLQAAVGELADIDWTGLSPADQTWLMLWLVLMIQEPRMGSMIPELEEALSLAPRASRISLTSAVHMGILFWIAAARDLTPIMAASGFELRIRVGLGLEWTGVSGPDPDVAYVRLAAPERAVVRQIARSFISEERHSALCEMSPGDDA